MAHLLEAIPRAAPYVVYYNCIPPLCAKLMAIEYIDVAEQARGRPPCPRVGAV